MYNVERNVMGIPGLGMIQNFVTQDESDMLVKMLNKRKWHKMIKNKKIVDRKVQHYGYRYDYGGKIPPSIADPIPLEYVKLIDRAKSLGVITEDFNQVIANEYEPGQGIGEHTDHEKFFDEEVMTLSLLSSTTMYYRVAKKHRTKGTELKKIPLSERSLGIMTKDARYIWTHEIPKRAVTEKRISLTFRKVSDEYIK